MTTSLMIARPVEGSVGERERCAHLFPVKPGDTLVAFCGAEFSAEALEWLDRMGGMPCEDCLLKSPNASVAAGTGAGSGDRQWRPATSVPPGFTLNGFDPDSSNPGTYLYDLVAEHLANMIETGKLAPRTLLPAEGALAREYGVSIGTARHATRLLRQRGLVVTLKSKGTYVAPHPPRHTAD